MGKKIKENILKPVSVWQWRVAEFLACVVVVLAPLYFNNNHWYPFGMPKISIVIGGSLLMGVFYLWGVFKNNKLSLKINPLHIGLIIFLSILTISSIFGVDPHNSFFGYFSFPTNLIFIYAVSLFGIIVSSLYKNNNNFLLKILSISFITSIIVAIFSYTGNSVFKNSVDFSSTIGNSSYAGAYLLFNIFFGIGFFFFYKKVWQKVLVFLATLFILLCPLFFKVSAILHIRNLSDITSNPMNFLGVANGALVGIFISFVVFILLLFIFSKKKILKISGFIILAMFMSGIIYAGFLLMNPSSGVHKAYEESKGENRFIAWNIAKVGFEKNPLLGLGYDNYMHIYHKEFKESEFGNNVESFSKPHNVAWEYLANTGILGFASYLALFALMFYVLISHVNNDENKKYRIFRISFVAILVGYFIQNLFIFDSVTTYLMFFLVFGLSSGLSSKYWEFNLNKEVRNTFAILFMIIFSISIILFSVLPWKESSEWKDLVTNKNLKESKNIREGLQGVSLFGGVIDSSYVANKMLNFYINNQDKVTPENKHLFVEEVDSSILALSKDMEKQPNNYNSHLNLSKLLIYKMYLAGSVDEDVWNRAYEELMKARELSPNDSKSYMGLSQLYVYKKDYTQAENYLKDAFLIAPYNKDVYNMAEKLLKINPNKEFEEFLKQTKN